VSTPTGPLFDSTEMLPNAAPNPASSTEPNASAAEQQQKGDFLGMFFSPSHQSPYVPFQGAVSAASAVMGGIWSVLDTALAVLNEEFDSNPSNSIISDDSNEDREGGSRIGGSRDKNNNSNVASCCRPTAQCQLSSTCGDTERASNSDEHQVSDDRERPSKCGEISVVQLYAYTRNKLHVYYSYTLC
jgi:hypothetical protein